MKLVYIYTPMCGTCQLAEKLLSIVEVMLKEETTLKKVNINFEPTLATKYQIESVPCLLKIEGTNVQKLYAFSDVTNLYYWIKNG